MTCREKILEVLSSTSAFLADHEIRERIPDSNEAAISARLREIYREGLVIGRRRKGKKYKEWQLSKGQQELFLKEEQCPAYSEPVIIIIDEGGKNEKAM